MEPFWNEHKERLLKKYVEEEGRKYIEIATLLKCSKSAAIAKAHRMGLKLKVSEVHKAGAPRTSKRKRKPKVLPTPVVRQPHMRKRPRNRLPLWMHNNDQAFWDYFNSPRPQLSSDIINIPGKFQCKWIEGDVKYEEARWCRHPTSGDSPYCKKHFKRVYYIKDTELRETA